MSLAINLTVVQIQDLSLYYAEKAAFQNINLAIPKHSITALIGPSGCGKTSFLNCLNRLIELTPKTKITGQILLESKDIQTMNVVDLRRRVGMLFQKPNPFPLSIIKNLEFPLREHGIKQRDRLDQIIEESLRQVGLWEEVKDRLKTPALSLSGGQQQRLCLARAIALQPEILLMDEPCSALDPISSEIVEDLIIRLRNHYTLIIVTHNLAQAHRIADQVALFWVQNGAGSLIESGTTAQVFERPQHPLTQAYINGRKG
ncbi:MAG: phosphate ABC transporter ATP-binding protein PstB [Pseudanabaena sp. CAN_BIN31]|nr:phosphate ABC transporter ATP-binding protein PstB [Pseudanabaena sp. CAN_BIN31]